MTQPKETVDTETNDTVAAKRNSVLVTLEFTIPEHQEYLANIAQMKAVYDGSDESLILRAIRSDQRLFTL